MKNANVYFDAKKALYEELGESYPMKKEELTPRFLYWFGSFVDGPNEDDFEDYHEYEDAKYSSEQWHFFCKLSECFAIKQFDGEEAFKKAWSDYLDWVVENYFPEFAIFGEEGNGLIHAHTEDLPFFDKSLDVNYINVKAEGMDGLVVFMDAISVMMFSEGPADYTIDASWYMSSFDNLMLLSYHLNRYVGEDGRGWKVRNGELFFNREVA